MIVTVSHYNYSDQIQQQIGPIHLVEKVESFTISKGGFPKLSNDTQLK